MAKRKDNFEELARVFLTMSNKIRLAVLQLLSVKEMNVTAMQEKLPCPQSTISHHLNLLYLAGLIVRRREHRKIFYSIADLSKHRLGKKSETTVPGCNAAKFGPMELVLLQKAGQSNKLKEIAEFFKLFSHKDRFRIVALLANGELNVMGIRKKLKLIQVVTSHHLNMLHHSGLVERRREHRKVFYKLADLSKHRLGQKPKMVLPGVNAARFGPAELFIPRK
jgi:DNA-binding transcriptional ArsR family regulator